MERIASFCVDHNTLVPGMYLSRKDGDVLTWDIRMKTPNKGSYLSPACAHTIEHLFATYARNSKWSEHVIYVGPMGCPDRFLSVDPRPDGSRSAGADPGKLLPGWQSMMVIFRALPPLNGQLPDDGPGGSTTGMQGYERSSAKAGC